MQVDYTFRSLNPAQILQAEENRHRGAWTEIRGGTHPCAPSYHVARGPGNSEWISATHSPMIVLHYIANALHFNNDARLAHTNAVGGNETIPAGDLIDSRTADLVGWPSQAHNNMRFCDELLKRNRFSFDQTVRFDGVMAAEAGMLADHYGEVNGRPSAFLQGYPLSMEATRRMFDYGNCDARGQAMAVTRGRSRALDGFFANPVAITAVASWGVYHTHNCSRVQRHTRRNSLDAPVMMPLAEMIRIGENNKGVHQCTTCTSKGRNLATIAAAYQTVLPAAFAV